MSKEVEKEILIEEVLEETTEINDGEVKITLTKGGVFTRIFAGVLDQAISLGVAALLMVIFDLILRLIGFKIVDTAYITMLLVFFFIVNCLYSPIMEKVKDGRTFGKRIMNIV